MKLNKENYEFLMFELLEGNLSQAEELELLAEIENDAFYKKEWQLMQQTIVVADESIVMPNKTEMLRTVTLGARFIELPLIMRIAASLLLLFVFGLGIQYLISPNTETVVVKNATPSTSQSDAVVNTPSTIEPQNNEQAIVGKTVIPPRQRIITASTVFPDSSLSSYQPEMLDLNEKVPVSFASGSESAEVLNAGQLILRKPKGKPVDKNRMLLAKAGNYANEAKEVWQDLPNLKFHLTPNLKGKKPSIGFELKGEVIYANALIELK